MRIPVVYGKIERRMLVNFRVRPEVLSRLLPPPFRLKLVRGWGMAGICLIRLGGIRPRFWPRWLGIRSENAAHRVAVEWEENGRVREGVFIHRRDTSSRLNSLVGGRIFPGVHAHARYVVHETAERFEVALTSDDGVTKVAVKAKLAGGLPPTSIFQSLDEASEFFRGGALGYSVTRDPTTFQGLELRCPAWKVEPLAVELIHSSHFEDLSLFPAGSIEFDCALLMRNIAHEWHGWPDLCCSVLAAA
jgi:hypothetical protein